MHIELQDDLMQLNCQQGDFTELSMLQGDFSPATIASLDRNFIVAELPTVHMLSIRIF